jgi:flagellar biosynthesis protein FlhG
VADQASLLRRLAGMAPTKRARVITVASGKGGVGKTNIVVNLGIQIARLGKLVTIVDADLGLANVDVILGQYFDFDLEHVLRGEKKLEDIIGVGPYGLRIVPSASGVPEMADMDKEQRERLIAELGHLENSTDILLIDTGAGISRNVLSFANLADDVLVVINPEPPSIADAYGLVKLLVQTGIAKNICLVVNRAINMQEGQATGDRFLAISERFLKQKIRFLGTIPDDPIVSQAVRRQHPFVLSHPESLPARQLESIAKIISGEDHLQTFTGKGFLAGLRRLFGGA